MTGPARPSAAAPRPTLLLAFPSQTVFLSLVRDLTKRMAEAAHFDATTSDGVALAALEAATNVLEHAYQGAEGREVELRVDDGAQDFRVEILDNGARVDARSMPRVELERYALERRTGGLGVHLMGKIMDSVSFRREGRRNVCCLLKRKDDGAPGRA